MYEIKPTITTCEAIVSVGDPSGVHRRISKEATNLTEAKAMFETGFGAGSAVTLWGEWESKQARNEIGKQK